MALKKEELLFVFKESYYEYFYPVLKKLMLEYYAGH